MPKKTINFDNIDAAIKAIQDDGMSQKSAAKILVLLVLLYSSD